MKNLRKYRLDLDASSWYFARMTGISFDTYNRYENMKDENIPEDALKRLKELFDLENEIKSYYAKAEDFYQSHELADVFKEHNKSIDEVAMVLGEGIETIKSCVEDELPFPDKNVRDKLIDFAMWLDNLKEDAPVEPDCEEVNTDSEEPNTISPDELTFPELPSQEVMSRDVEGVSKDDEIAGLNRQIDWYEDIIVCFTHLAELAYKNNK